MPVGLRLAARRIPERMRKSTAFCLNGEDFSLLRRIHSVFSSWEGETKMIRLLSPRNGETVFLLTEKQRRFRSQGCAGGLDWLNLQCSEGEDCSLPVKVEFIWEGGNGEYLFELSENVEFHGARMIRTNEKNVRVGNLKMNQQYFWRVDGAEACSFRTEDAAPRWIEVDGISNVRDIGAWRTKDGGRIRQGMVYRGGELDVHMTVTERGMKTLREELGIRTDLDIRAEAVGRISESPMGADVNFQLIPVVAYGEFFSEEQKEACRRVFSLFADETNYPIYFHCWGGADRTGTIAIVLQALLGADEEDVLTDYELTSLSIWGERSRTSEWFPPLIEALDRFGSEGDDINRKAENFLLWCGVTEEQIRSIRRILREP